LDAIEIRMQLQISYDPAEDRLLLTLGIADRRIGFWLTRRLTAMLWQALWQRAGSSVDAGVTSTAKEWLLRLKQDRARQTSEVTQEPRLQTGSPPLLVTTVQYGPGDKGGHVLSLIDATGKGETLTLDDDSLYGLIRLLDDTLTSSEWGLDLWRPMSMAAADASSSQVMH